MPRKIPITVCTYDYLRLPLMDILYKHGFELAHFPANIALVGTEPGMVREETWPDLQYIICPCTNTNHITNYTEAKIISLTGETKFLNSIVSTAEHTLFLMLSLIKRHDRACVPGHILRGKTVLIIGYGRGNK